MKKKILTSFLFVGLLAGLVGCNKPAEDNFSKTVLADTENAAWVLHGQFKLADGTDNGWNGKSSELYNKSKMTATSVDAVSKIDINVARTLAKKDLRYLYVYEGAQFGKNDAGWTARYHDEEGTFYKVNGSYVFKAAKVSYAADDDVYAEQQWIHDPKTANAEALTENLFMPTWQQALDDYGFSWADNLVIKGANPGKYTVVVAQYNTSSAKGVPGYGIAVIQTEKDGLTVEPKFVPSDHTYGLIGSFAGSGWSTDVALVGSEYGPYKADVTLAENDEFKVRCDGAWDISFGWANVNQDEIPADTFEDKGGNIGAKVAGTYTVTVNFSKIGVALISIAVKA